MHEYETLTIFHPNQSDNQIELVNEKIRGIVEKHSGKLFFARNMGRKTLAYPIEKQARGTYVCYDYAAQGSAIAEIERLMRYDETIVRFMTVTKNADVNVEARAQEIVARGEDKVEFVQPSAEITTDLTHDRDDDSDDN